MTFWHNQKVVITGGAGFVGSHLVEMLIEAGADVTVLDNFSRGGNVVHGARYQTGLDATNINDCLYAMNGAFAVFNLAALVAGVIYNQSNHAEMYETNMRLQSVPVQAAEQVGVQHFLQVSSVCVYSPDHNHPCLEINGHEGFPTKANEGYSWAKRMGERVASWSRVPHVVIARPSNVFGPRDYFDERAHVIPALIKKALTQDVIEVNGTGKEQREFAYVTDVASGLMHVLEYGENREAYNIGTHGNTCLSVASLMEQIQHATGMEHKQVRFSSTYDPGDPKRWSECSRIHALGWSHDVDMASGLQKTVDWYMEEHNK